MVDGDGALLRALATPQGAWRFRVTLDEVDPHFVDMLIAYEDRRFRRHVGIDPAALARAADWRPRAAAASGKTENKLLGFIGNVPKNLLGPIPNPLIVLTIRHLR